MFGMRDVQDVGCSEYGMFGVGCLECWVLGVWDAEKLGCSGCGIFGIWGVGVWVV